MFVLSIIFLGILDDPVLRKADLCHIISMSIIFVTRWIHLQWNLFLIELDLQKELVRRRLFGGFAPCHFVLHGLTNPVEMEYPTTPKNLLDQIIHIQNICS